MGVAGEVKTIPIEEIIEEEIPQYKVILLNDDITTFDFVIWLLQYLFGKSEPEAIALTFKIDEEGSGVVGIYPKEVAEAKQAQVHQLARQHGFPLRAVIEEV
jgi:ATP-dependent Clp protease adaptor protein ClpS